MEHRYFPLFVNLENKKVLLVGAGNIALRRAKGLLRFGVILTVTAPDFVPEFADLQKEYGKDRLLLQKCAFAPGYADGCDLVLSATDDRETDLAVYRECRDRNIPVNIASDQSLCDFYFPALIEQGDLVVGVSSGGRDHRKVRRVSAKLREWFQAQEDP